MQGVRVCNQIQIGESPGQEQPAKQFTAWLLQRFVLFIQPADLLRICYCSAHIDNKSEVDTLYLDLAKAFDKVPHQRLLQNLKAHGIQGQVCSWIEAWLSKRHQRACLDGSYSTSTWRQVWSEVPQGSVLGPVLFLIFINDLDIELGSSVMKFADDTKIYRPVNSISDCQDLQRDLNTVCSWAKKWQMEFNVSKCKTVHYGKKNICHKYTVEGQPVEEVSKEKDLGVVFTK